jgi:hypothetical protein
MGCKSNLIFFIVAILTSAAIVSQHLSIVFGQMANYTGTLSPLVNKELSSQTSQLKKVFGDKFTSELSSKCGIISTSCVEVEYESPNTIVLRGDYLIFNSTLTDYNANQFIWKAVDDLKTKGFVINSVTMGGVGSQGNPNLYHVIMSKK